MNIGRHAAIGVALLAGGFLVTACGATANTASSSSAAPGGGASAGASATPSAPETGNPGSAVTLNEDGSSLIYPFLEKLVDPLHAAYPNITLAPAPGGSGKGISDAAANTVQMGGSDAYLSSGQMSQYPNLLNIPIAISAQAINYNLPGVSLPSGQTGLKLTGDVIAQIYEGTITKWNASQIAALNPGVTLPSTTIVPIRRVDASGDTFIFTSFLSATNSAWKGQVSFGTTVTWPHVGSEQTGNGNPDMVNRCHATPGCIAYIGVSVEQSALSDGLGEVELGNAAGNFVLPTQGNISSAVSAGAGSIPANLAKPLIYGPGANSYPIINVEYIMVQKNQSSADLALAMRTFLMWAQSPGGGSQAQYLGAVDFVALPSTVLPPIRNVIAEITG